MSGAAAIAKTQDVAIVAGLGPERAHIFSVIVKRSYAIRSHQPLVEMPAEQLLRADRYHEPGDPETCSLWLEEECAPYKLATDVVVLAQAYPPEGKPAQRTTVGVEVAGHQKLLTVTGDRRAVHRAGRPPDITDPDPFTTMPIRYERAYGGIDAQSRPEAPFHYPRNPIGRGVALRNLPEVIDGLALPNIEDPNDLLTPERIVIEDEARWNDQPFAQGFGWFQKTWYPRCSFVGALPPHVQADTTMREEQLGLVPQGQIALGRGFRLPSFDLRFNTGASLGLALPEVPPGATVRLARLSPEPLIEFTLPTRWPRIALDIGQGVTELPCALHTLLIDVEARRVDMIWRGAHSYPGPSWLPSMTRLAADVQ